jgi:hypothetical protein
MALSRPSIVGLATALTASLLACGSSSGGGTTDAGNDTGKATDSGADTRPPVESGTKDTGGGGKDTGPADTGGPDKSPITGLENNKWVWVPFAGALCRDGSSTGIGVNLGTSKNLMIFLEGGGACFNGESCADQNASSFSAADFASLAAGTNKSYSITSGIMDRTNAANPVQDWSYVYVPYCTGDIHGGNNVTVVPEYPGTQHFVGYENVGLYLDRIVPTFSEASQVLLSGMSAGGFGAAANYSQVAKAFGSTEVVLLDDSGPFFENPALATCLSNDLRKLWGLDKTVLLDCGSDCTDPSAFFLDYARHIMKAYPKASFGMADSMDDGTISFFFGFGYKNCTSFQQVSASVFGAGLLDIRTKLAAEKNYGEFLFNGTDHTSIQDAVFYTRTAGGNDAGVGGVLMTDWVKGLLAGKPTNPGP